MSKLYYIYVLECSNNSYYTGYTTDIARRYQEHCDSSGRCNYTRSFPPVRIAACWSLNDDSSSPALRIERMIKQLLRPDKERLIRDPSRLATLLKSKGYSLQGIDRGLTHISQEQLKQLNS